ncbi:hypothetical protein [Corallococcus sp. AB011P]|uniref:hypothetical protein n=1 Tax=Corallococcus sp. AB011P TaxID=2316735 RepID=UPI0035180796
MPRPSGERDRRPDAEAPETRLPAALGFRVGTRRWGLLEENPHFEQVIPQLHLDRDFEDREDRMGNAFSGDSYRVLNFVVDLPLRMDPYLPPPESDTRPRKGRVTFALVEFQIADKKQLAVMNSVTTLMRTTSGDKRDASSIA